MSREQVAELLHRYPHVSDAEAKLILTFLRKGRHLDVGMLTADARLKPNLDIFMKDHAKQLGVGFGEAAAVVAAITGFLAACWVIWEIVNPATA
jgi:hypothetical protein